VLSSQYDRARHQVPLGGGPLPGRPGRPGRAEADPPRASRLFE